MAATDNVIATYHHGHVVVNRLTDKGWKQRLYAVDEDGGLNEVGDGEFKSLADAISSARARQEESQRPPDLVRAQREFVDGVRRGEPRVKLPGELVPGQPAPMPIEGYSPLETSKPDTLESALTDHGGEG